MSLDAISSTGSALTEQIKSDNADLGKEDFLKLLISQMQHQDPLEPMKNSEFVAQLATFSNVEQLVSVNDGIANLAAMQASSYDAQTATYIGKEVQVASDQVSVNAPGQEIESGFLLEGNADNVIVNFRNATGDVVRRIDMGPQGPGNVAITWDGYTDTGQPSIPGVYRIDILASTADGSPVNHQTQVKGIVDGVTYESGYPELIIGSTKATAANIIGVYQKTGSL